MIGRVGSRAASNSRRIKTLTKPLNNFKYLGTLNNCNKRITPALANHSYRLLSTTSIVNAKPVENTNNNGVSLSDKDLTRLRKQRNIGISAHIG